MVKSVASERENPRREARGLAAEFGTSVEVMEAFLRRFSPRWTRADQFASASDVMLFVHVPKTAGISLGVSLKRVFDKVRLVDWADPSASFRVHMRHALYLQTQRPVRQALIGHFGWPELQVWRSQDLPLKCATLLRDPLARAVSNYFYNCSDAHPDHLRFREQFPDLTSYVRQLPLDVQMTQAVGMVDSFERALEKFISHYSFLGVTEHLAASLDHLSRTHGFVRLKEKRMNVGKIKPPVTLPEEVVDFVERKSHNDMKLHRLLMRLYVGT
ncbi:MAG: sulfotransferase family 2 domain-containing protein [Rhodobacteraceae bacterium]|nr:sulfotransferase family 2 domain-containing protein [Paracoccaceae bacterium]